MFDEAGLAIDNVSAGGTGSFDIGGAMDGITEIQAGSYALMDTDYARLDLPFEHALFVLGTVISRPAPERCVADCGHKSCTKDHGLPSVKGLRWRVRARLSTTNTRPSRCHRGCTLAIGDRIQLLPSHVDPTMNLHDVVYALDGDDVIGAWPVAARGYSGAGRYWNTSPGGIADTRDVIRLTRAAVWEPKDPRPSPAHGAPPRRRSDTASRRQSPCARGPARLSVRPVSSRARR